MCYSCKIQRQIAHSISLPKGIPKCLLGQVLFWGPGIPRPKNHKLLRKLLVCWPCRQRRQGQQTTNFLKMCGCLALVPEASKNHLAPKTLRDPSHLPSLEIQPQTCASHLKFNAKSPTRFPYPEGLDFLFLRNRS